MAKILVIDDDRMICKMVRKILQSLNHDVESAHTLAEGFDMAAQSTTDLILLDVRLPDGNGIEALPALKRTDSTPEIIIITGEGDPDGAVIALESGAWDYLLKPLSSRELSLHVTRALEYRAEKMRAKSTKLLKRDYIIGDHPKILESLEMVASYAETDLAVLISGDTGTGKELFARAIHDNSDRALSPFIVLDCAAFPEQLVESVLFGHSKGAFTGADQDRDGLILQADRGTIFMDEIGELPLHIQKKFLRVLQEKSFRPVGGKQELKSDFRLIAATNRDLDQMVEDGRFREDLLFRLKASIIRLPSLCERKSDIELLARHYVAFFCKRYGLQLKGISTEFMDYLKEYNWPGNIREFINVINHSIANSKIHDILFPIHMPVEVRAKIMRSALERDDALQIDSIPSLSSENLDMPSLNVLMKETERRYIETLLLRTDGDIQAACKVSGLSRSGLYAKMKKYNIHRPS